MKKKPLIIVESPTKINTLKKILGSSYSYAASLGHIRDLPKKGFGIDVDNNFEPLYENLPEKKEVIKNLKEYAKNADIVYLATDPDREGEAIAWHIAQLLPKKTHLERATFNAFTPSAIHEGLKKTREIDQPLVNAQQARRLLDRIVGYKISPILTRKIGSPRAGGLSAGRVQSVALKFVVDREKEIESFIPKEYWNIKTILKCGKKEPTLEAFLYSIDGKRVEKELTPEKEDICTVSDKQTADSIVKQLKKASYKVLSVDKKEKKRNPVPPFITSSLQQEASRHYGFSASRTMGIAQSLYEGVDMKAKGVEGLITYMRTDSTSIAPEPMEEVRGYIKETFGKQFLPESPRIFPSRKRSQEAHEAIRPTSVKRTPESVKEFLTSDQFKLYQLIWKRFVASQMNPAIYDTVSVDIEADNMVLRATGSLIKFPGFLAVYQEKEDSPSDEEKKILIPPLKEGEKLSLIDILSDQSFTKPPPRYTEASLVKELEKSGIGRPSTYAAIMNKIQSRDYTTKENGALKPTELGKIIVQMLEENFKMIMDVAFTASLEDALELVEEDKRKWKELIKDFWEYFMLDVESAEKEAKVPKITTDIICPKCGHNLQKIWSKGKYFYGCSNYPNCDYTAPLEALTFRKEDYDPNFDWDQNCPVCGNKMQLRFGRFGPFLGCVRYPECKGIVPIMRIGAGVETTKGKKQKAPPCPAIGCDGKVIERRSRFGKIFYSCSNYPDCDVIVNDLKDLEKKYIDHPKTPAPKKGLKKGGRFQKEMNISKELQVIVGKDKMSRGDVTKKIWEYIKEHNCQDPKNKRLIVPDKKLAKVLKTTEPVDMMKLAGLLSPHLS